MPVSDDPRTKYFSLQEWEQRVGKVGWEAAEPYPREWTESRWRPLAQMLDRIRERLGEPIKITPSGGYRAPAHNRAVRGARNSQHAYGRAADIVAAKASPKKVHALILQMWNEGALPELGGLGIYDGFAHVDVRPKARPGALARWDETGPEGRDQIA